MKNTYSLLLKADAEEKGRSIFETSVYSLVAICCALSAWQFASGDVVLPTGGQTASSQAAYYATAPAQPAQPVRG